jgi:hypothetical protein
LNSQRPFHSRSIFPGRYTVEHVFLDASNRMWPKIDESKGSHRASESTWTHPASTSPWPKDLLPSRLPKARIVTYGYDAYSLRLQQFVITNRSRDQRSSDVLTAHRATSSTSGRPSYPLCSLSGLLSRNNPRWHFYDIFEHVSDIQNQNFLGIG